jgi:hypothetical protein
VAAPLGYELVEGQLRDRRIAELRRIDFAPGAVMRSVARYRSAARSIAPSAA